MTPRTKISPLELGTRAHKRVNLLRELEKLIIDDMMVYGPDGHSDGSRIIANTVLRFFEMKGFTP